MFSMSKQVRERYQAFWECSCIDRPLLFVTAPQADAPRHPDDGLPADRSQLNDWYMNPARVLPRLKRRMQQTYHAGEALPIVFPMAPNMAAIQAAFMGGEYSISPDNGSGWCDRVIDDMDAWTKAAAVDPDNLWWKQTRALLSEARALANDGIIIGHPDTQGGGQVLALLRGTEELILDLVDQPESAKAAMAKIDETWLEYWNTMNAIIGEYQFGSADWLAAYCDKMMVCPECDMSCMISKAMFDEFFLPSIRFQCEQADYSIYHLDGPGALQHVESLLELSSLDGIQWVPGAGAKPVVEWIPLLQKIQSAGKLLHLSCPKEHVVRLASSIRPEGVYIRTSCDTADEAEELVASVGGIFGGK